MSIITTVLGLVTHVLSLLPVGNLGLGTFGL